VIIRHQPRVNATNRPERTPRLRAGFLCQTATTAPSLQTVVRLEGDTQCVHVILTGQAVIAFALIVQTVVHFIQLGRFNEQVSYTGIKAPVRVQRVGSTGGQPLTVIVRYTGGTVALFHRRFVKGVTRTQSPVFVQHILSTDRNGQGVAPFLYDMTDVVITQTTNVIDDAFAGGDDVEVFKGRPICPGSTGQQQQAVAVLVRYAQSGRARTSQRHAGILLF